MHAFFFDLSDFYYYCLQIRPMDTKNFSKKCGR